MSPSFFRSGADLVLRLAQAAAMLSGTVAQMVDQCHTRNRGTETRDTFPLRFEITKQVQSLHFKLIYSGGKSLERFRPVQVKGAHGAKTVSSRLKGPLVVSWKTSTSDRINSVGNTDPTCGSRTDVRMRNPPCG